MVTDQSAGRDTLLRSNEATTCFAAAARQAACGYVDRRKGDVARAIATARHRYAKRPLRWMGGLT